MRRAIGWEFSPDGPVHIEDLGPKHRFPHLLTLCGLYEPGKVHAEYNVDFAEDADPDKPPDWVCRACYAHVVTAARDHSSWAITQQEHERAVA